MVVAGAVALAGTGGTGAGIEYHNSRPALGRDMVHIGVRWPAIMGAGWAQLCSAPLGAST
jgi:hypothetical protein